MKLPYLTLLLIVSLGSSSYAQQRKSKNFGSRSARPARSTEVGQTAVVIDDSLSVLRMSPSLFAEPVQRVHRGRRVQILGVTEADGVKFYKVTAPPANYGWIQADAVYGKFRPGDEERFARLIQATEGFEQIEIAGEFFSFYPDSKFRPALLLLYGDLLEEVAAKLTKEANSKIKRNEMAASAAPMHSYFLNFVSLDRYRKQGIIFLFNPTTRQYHYDGNSWKEIVAKFASSGEAIEAKKRLDALRLKMEAVPSTAK